MCNTHGVIGKEIINVRDGARLGCVEDVIVDCMCGQILQLITLGFKGPMSVFCRKEKMCIDWMYVCKIGEDIILVDIDKFRE